MIQVTITGPASVSGGFDVNGDGVIDIITPVDVSISQPSIEGFDSFMIGYGQGLRGYEP